MMDYLKWRGDLTLRQSPFNNIDNLILSTLTYIDFEKTGFDLSGKSNVTIKEAGEQFARLHSDDNMKLGLIIPDIIFTLFDELSRSKRFQNMKLSYYVNEVDERVEMQFSAITVELGNGDIFVGFRGTDDTIVGWKEDFNMCYCSPVPSQIRSVKYLQQVAPYRWGKIYLGGHSKGGNLSIFAAVYSGAFLRRRVAGICSFDGPGFTKEILKNEDYIALKPKIHAIVPQSSFFGILFEHDEDFCVVESTQIGLFQHDMFSWQVMGNDFNYVEEISPSANGRMYTMREFLKAMTMDERKKFVEAIFYIFEETGAKTLSELKVKDVLAILHRMNKEDHENKKVLSQALRLLMQILPKKK